MSIQSEQNRSKSLCSCAVSFTACDNAIVQFTSTIQMVIQQYLLQIRDQQWNLSCKTV